jgi:DNA polymerase III subunit gamma/tau
LPDASALRDRWTDVLDSTREVRKVAWILLGNASIDSVEGNVLSLTFEREGDAKGFASSGCDQVLADVVDRMFGVRPIIRTGVGSAPGRGGSGGGQSGSARTEPDRSGGRSESDRSGGARPESDRSGGARSEPDRSGGARSEPDRSGSARTEPDRSGGGRTEPSNSVGSAGSTSTDRSWPDAPLPDDGWPDDEEGGGRPAADRRPARPAPAADSSGQSAARAAAAAAAAARPSGSPANGAASARNSEPSRRQAKSPTIYDDPREQTDPDLPGAADVTGTDLIMRELGGKVIEEIGES